MKLADLKEAAAAAIKFAGRGKHAHPRVVITADDTTGSMTAEPLNNPYDVDSEDEAAAAKWSAMKKEWSAIQASQEAARNANEPITGRRQVCLNAKFVRDMLDEAGKHGAKGRKATIRAGLNTWSRPVWFDTGTRFNALLMPISMG